MFKKTIGRTIVVIVFIAAQNILTKGIRTSHFGSLSANRERYVNSNGLGDSASRPDPLFDYDSLIEQVKGDFGVKSQFIASVSKDPQYNGAETLVLPLYIPKGAVPIRLARIARNSNGAQNKATIEVVDFPLTQSEFLRRLGPISARLASPPRINRTSAKSNNTARAPSIRRADISSSQTSTTLSPSKLLLGGWGLRLRSPLVSPIVLDSESEIYENVRLKKNELSKTSQFTNGQNDTENITALISSPVAEIPQGSVHLVSLKVVQNTTTTTTESSKLQLSITKPPRISKLSLPRTVSSVSSLNVDSLVETPTSDQLTPKSINDNRRLHAPLSADEIVVKRKRLNITTSLLTEPIANQNKVNNETKSNFGTKTRLSESGDSVPLVRRPPWNLRQRISIPSSVLEESKSTKYTENLLNKSQAVSTHFQAIKDENTDQTPLILRPSRFDTVQHTKKEETAEQDSKVDNERKLFIVRRPSIKHDENTNSNTNSVKLTTDSSTTVQQILKETPSTISPVTQRRRRPIRLRKPGSTTEKPTVEATASSTPESFIFFSRTPNPAISKTEGNQKNNTFTTNSIVRQPSSENELHSKDELFRTTTPYGVTSKNMTPEKLVIESLTEIMKGATNGSKIQLTDIATDLEALNKRLAERGIHIIHAEIDGKKIPLSPQALNIFPTTIRPFHGRRPVKPQHITSKDPNFQVNNKPKQVFTSVKTSFSYQTSKPPLENDTDDENEVAEAGPVAIIDNSPSIIKPGSLFDKIFETSKKLPSIISETKDTTTQKSQTNESKQKQQTVDQIHTLHDLDQSEKNDLSSEIILPSSTLHPSTATRTRSTTIPVSLPSSESPQPPYILIHFDQEQLPEDKFLPKKIYPTSHFRPTHLNGNENAHDNLTPVKEDNNAEDAESSTEDVSNADSSNSTNFSIIGVIAIVPAAALSIFFVRRFFKKETKALPESEVRVDSFSPVTHHSRKISAREDIMSVDSSSVEATNPKYSPWELPRSKIRLVSVLGEGNFGVVWKAEARGLCEGEGTTVLVAVKKVKENAGTKERQDLLKELSLMKHLGGHPNVVTLLGCCTQQEPHYVVMEYVMFGKLLTFLRDHRSKQNYFNFSSDTQALTSRDLTRFACQIATGCEYLQSRGIIHRDLAARNILVDHNKVCKIADFGLARNVRELGSDIYEQKSRGPLPIRWMAPESLYMNIFTHKSDVWSFGILCWEIVTLGSTPYPGLSAREVIKMVREGYRLERPHHCRPEFYRVVTTCWHQDLNKRPSFTELKLELANLPDHHAGYIDLENFPEDDYYSMHENNEEKL